MPHVLHELNEVLDGLLAYFVPHNGTNALMILLFSSPIFRNSGLEYRLDEAVETQFTNTPGQTITCR